MPKYTMLVFTNAKEGRDDEFNDWYTNHHLGHILALPGIASAQRFKCVDEPGVPAPKYRYAATYELETDDPGAVIANMFALHGTDALPASDAMDEKSDFSFYEAVTPVVTK